MKLDDISSVVKTLIPVATVFFNLVVKIAGMMLQIVRSQLQGIAYSVLVAARAKFLTITKRQSYYMPKNLGTKLPFLTHLPLIMQDRYSLIIIIIFRIDTWVGNTCELYHHQTRIGQQ